MKWRFEGRAFDASIETYGENLKVTFMTDGRQCAGSLSLMADSTELLEFFGFVAQELSASRNNPPSVCDVKMDEIGFAPR
jgi:hypothetical protein